MHLLDLPIEILTQVLGYVGTLFFRSDLKRLTICKHWSEIARTVCFQDLHLTPETMRRLSSASESQSSLPLVQSNLETLDLKLESYGGPDSNPGPQDDRQFAKWRTELHQDLLFFADLMGVSRNFRALCLQATSEWQARRPTRRNYLYRSTICTMLEVKPLTILELDLSGTELLPLVNGEPDRKLHICMTISALLPTLRRLRLRMHRICGEVLKLQKDCINLRLNEVIINLSLPYDSPFISLASHARVCTYTGVQPWTLSGTLRLEQDLKEQAEALVPHIAGPRMVRILTHAPTECGMHALDVLTGRYLRLREDAEWDDASEVLVESDQESDISSFHSDDEGMYGVFQGTVGGGG